MALDLHAPQAGGVRAAASAADWRASCVVELDEPEQFLGPVEGEDLAAAGVGSRVLVNCVTAPVDS